LLREVIFTLRRCSKNRSTAIIVKKKELSIDEKLKIQVWIVTGVKTAEIAARLGRGESTIRRLRAELKELPPRVSPLPCRPISGCPRATTHAEDEMLKRYVEKFPSKMSKS
jgi:transposase